LKAEYSDAVLEQCRIRVHEARDIATKCISYLTSKILLNILSSD
jgi:hypothetical protein